MLSQSSLLRPRLQERHRETAAQMSAPQTHRYWCRVCVVLNRDRLPAAAVCSEEGGGGGALPTCILPSVLSVFASSLFFSVWFFHPGIKATSFPQLAARIIPPPSVRREIGCQISAATTGLHTSRRYCAFMKLNIHQSTRFNI